MGGKRIRTPIDDEVRPIANLAKRAGDLADLMLSHHGWGMAKRSGRIDHSSEAHGQPDRSALSIAGTAGQAINQRIGGRAEQFGASTNGGFKRHGFIADLSNGR
jgi:hypothetical protein